MHTHTGLYASGLGGEVRVSPLGPGIVPLCCPCVVVDKVDSAIVLALLCGNKQEMNRKKKFYGIACLQSANEKTKHNNKTQIIIILKMQKKPQEIRNNSITTCGRSEGFALFRGENVSPRWQKTRGLVWYFTAVCSGPGLHVCWDPLNMLLAN